MIATAEGPATSTITGTFSMVAKADKYREEYLEELKKWEEEDTPAVLE